MPIPLNQEPIERQTTKEKVYQSLRDWIIDGTLKPREKISDAEISKCLSVSRTPVREAFQMLSEQNLIEVIPGKETRVAPINIDNIRNAYLTLSVLNGLAVKQAYEHIKEKDICNLSKINARLKKAIANEDISKMRECDNDFHSYFLNLANNPFLVNFYSQLIVHINRMENIYFKYKENFKITTLEDHEQIVEFLKAHNLEQAVATMEANWLHLIDITTENLVSQDIN